MCWYRNVLCSRAKRISECPQGNLVNKKATKCGTSGEKYAKDCLILYLFTQGERSGIECVFDKNKNTNQSKINLVEIRVIIQSLTQRVTEIEEALDSKNKTFASLKKRMQNLQSEHDQLKLNHESFKDAATSRFSRYNANHKLTSDMFKRVESDFKEFQNVQSKTNDDIKRLAKVSSTCQEQISSIDPNKTYANAASEQTKASPTSPDQNVQNNTDECRNAPKMSSFKTIYETIAEKIHSIRVDNPNRQDSGVGNTSSVPKSSTPDCTQPQP